MDSDGAGPSNIKKRKLTFKNPKKLTEDELLYLFMCSVPNIPKNPLSRIRVGEH